MFGAVDAWLDIPSDHTVSDLVQNFDRLDLTLLKRSITRHASGLYVVPHPASMQEAAIVDPERLRRLFGLLKAAFGTIVIDTSKGLQSSDFLAFEISDVILVVIQLDLVCLRNTARLLSLFREDKALGEKVQLVVNRIGSFDWEISQKKAEQTLKMPISWQIPNAAKQLQEVRIKGVPIAEVGRVTGR
jgi:pilus assembly protein CpaE